MRSEADIEEAIDRYGDAVLRACSAYLHSRHDAEDAFQDTYLRYARYEEAFSDEDHRKAWLLRVAMNICKDHLRSASSKVVPLDESMNESIEPDDERLVERMRMRQAMGHLSEDQRTALVLSVVEGYTVPDIARMMGKPENTIYSHITRAKRKLEKVLGNDGS